MSNHVTQEQIPQKVGEILTRDTQAWVVRFMLLLLGLIGTGSIGYFWLYADQHNDLRYISIRQYENGEKETRREIGEVFGAVATLQNQKNADHDAMVEMRNDIKWIRERLTTGKE